jgi:hypothetical protein
MLCTVGYPLWRVVFDVCTADEAGRCEVIPLHLHGELLVNHDPWFTPSYHHLTVRQIILVIAGMGDVGDVTFEVFWLVSSSREKT